MNALISTYLATVTCGPRGDLRDADAGVPGGQQGLPGLLGFWGTVGSASPRRPSSATRRSTVLHGRLRHAGRPPDHDDVRLQLRSRTTRTLSPARAEVMAGRYALEREIGRGGAGIVHLAPRRGVGEVGRHQAHRSPARHDRGTTSPAPSVRHGSPPGSTTRTWCRSSTSWKDEDCYWLVMEHVEGRTLAELIRADGPPSPTRVRPASSPRPQSTLVPGTQEPGRAPRRQAQQHHGQRRQPRKAG